MPANNPSLLVRTFANTGVIIWSTHTNPNNALRRNPWTLPYKFAFLLMTQSQKGSHSMIPGKIPSDSVGSTSRHFWMNCSSNTMTPQGFWRRFSTWWSSENRFLTHKKAWFYPTKQTKRAIKILQNDVIPKKTKHKTPRNHLEYYHPKQYTRCELLLVDGTGYI